MTETPPRLLVVDDEPSIRSALRRLVRHIGYEAVEAGSAAEALERVAETDDLRGALLDYNMPGMGGVELARRLKERLPGLPVLLLSGGIIDEEVQAALDEGLLWAYVSKPWELAWMREAVTRLVGGEAPPPPSTRG